MELPKEFTGEGLYINAKAGIYAIINPIGEIYIGQSTDLEERIRKHKKEAGGRHPLLAKSMVRHGRKNHHYYLVMELDQTVDQTTLWEWEKFYIHKFANDGYKMLNANGGGVGGKKGGFGSTGRRITHQVDYDKYNQPL